MAADMNHATTTRKYPVRSMGRLRETLVTEDLVMISGQGERTHLKNKHKSIKKKVFDQSLDIKATEVWIDFCKHFDAGEYEEAVRFYYILRRMIG